MRIAINSRFLISGKMEGIGWYSFEIIKRLVENHPECEFILFFDRNPGDDFEFGANATKVVLRPPARHPHLFKIWFNYAVSRALKKYKADLFFSPDGFLSLRTEVPQIGVMHDLNFEHHPEDLPPHFLRYYKKYFPLFAHRAKHIITVSEASKKDIEETYGIEQSKITAIWNGVSTVFQPMDESLKPVILNKYSQSNPYFLFVGALHPRKNLRRLLQAYVDLRSENPGHPYHLVIVGESLWKDSAADLDVPDDIKKYVHFTGRLSLDELSKVTASASIFCFVPYFEGFGIPLVEAMRSGVPIIAGNKTSIPEVAGDAALYCDPLDVTDIKLQLIKLSSDEKLRIELIEKGLIRSKLFNWDTAASEVWGVIEKTLS